MNSAPHKTNFIRQLIEKERLSQPEKPVITRFPPEPNGYLHIGHAKSIFLNFGLAKDYHSLCYLRFDDTNPCTEDIEYMTSIQEDVRWLGGDWGDRLRYASDYFPIFYECALRLIQKGLAYVCSLPPEAVREYRGTLTTPGKNSPDRDRSIAENLDLFTRMKAGEFADGTYCLRAKIDMSSPNLNLRDPMLYRIRKVPHPHVGDAWCIYPMYDYAHPLSDAIEEITYSLCTLEFQDHRPLYNWVIEHCGLKGQPQQIEFSRLAVSYTLTSKRKLKHLVEGSHVNGWNDPRMPTLSGLRRRGVTPRALQNFCEQVGISKQDSVIDVSVLEDAIRDDLNIQSIRRMAVLDPLKLVIENLSETLMIEISNHPNQPERGRRPVSFGPELYIERSDFEIHPPAGFQRLSPGKSVRLLNAYVIECTRFEQDDKGRITTVYARYLPETFQGKKPADGRKVEGFIHWVCAKTARTAEIRLYDRLFQVDNPGEHEDFLKYLNPESLTYVKSAYVEASLAEIAPETRVQFNRLGYFCADRFDHRPQENLVFNRTVSLRSSA